MIEIKTEADTTPYKISTRLLMQAALRKGYQITYFPSAPSTMSGITRCEKDGKEFFFKSTCTALTASYGVFAAENKCLTHSLLTAHGIQTPDIVTLTPDDSLRAAEKLLKSFSAVVVKPSDLNHGDGVSINITDTSQLERAVEFARKAGGPESDVIVQRQVSGDEYRFLVVEGKVVAVASRRPPHVEGDGLSTVRELIEEKNKDPRRGKGHSSVLTVIDSEEVKYHRGEEFLEKVLSKGERVQVLDTSNLSRGGESVDFTDEASPALKKMAVAAAERCFLGVAGVDIMTKDVTADSTEDSYVIEVNLTPGIRMHQFPSEGKPRDVAKSIFAAMEKTARPVGKPVKHIGRVERVSFPELSAANVPSRIDTGATVSSIWASKIKETDNGLEFVLFDTSSELYTGEVHVVPNYGKRAVSSSMGHVQVRYQIKTTISISGRRISASITLANRSNQVYPVLIGRNVLHRKFVVDVSAGHAASKKERARRAQLDDMLSEREES